MVDARLCREWMISSSSLASTSVREGRDGNRADHIAEGPRMIYVTRDTHGNFRRFEKEYFPAGQNLCREDYVIVCREFGKWDETRQSNQGPGW